jgi:hypothetical protein
MSKRELQEALLELPEHERQEMAYWLLDTIADEPVVNDEVMKESIRSAEERSAELDSGRVKALTHEEVWSKIDRLCASWK